MSKAHLVLLGNPLTGDILYYPQPIYDHINQKQIQPVNVPNFEFTATLKMIGYSRGMSSVLFKFKDDIADKEYVMFISDFINLVPHMNAGVVTGTFTYCKKGKCYGIMFIR